MNRLEPLVGFDPFSYLILISRLGDEAVLVERKGSPATLHLDDSFVPALAHEYIHFLTHYTTPFFLDRDIVPFLEAARDLMDTAVAGKDDGSGCRRIVLRKRIPPRSFWKPVYSPPEALVESIGKNGAQWLFRTAGGGSIPVTPLAVYEHVAVAAERLLQNGPNLRPEAPCGGAEYTGLEKGIPEWFADAGDLRGRLLDALFREDPVRALFDGKAVGAICMDGLAGRIRSLEASYGKRGLSPCAALLGEILWALHGSPLRALFKSLSAWNASGSFPQDYMDRILSLFPVPAITLKGNHSRTASLRYGGGAAAMDPYAASNTICFLWHCLTGYHGKALEYHPGRIVRGYCHLHCADVGKTEPRCARGDCTAFRTFQGILESMAFPREAQPTRNSSPDI